MSPTVRNMMSASTIARLTRNAKRERARLAQIIEQFEALTADERDHAVSNFRAGDTSPRLWEERA